MKTTSPNPGSTRYAHVATQVRQMIRRGVLKPGMRVPSVRHISRQQRVSMTTAQAAYRVLERERLIEAKPRSGYFVRYPDKRLAEPRMSRPSSAPRLVTLGERGLSIIRSASDPSLVVLGTTIPSLDLLPVKALARISARVARQFARECTSYDLLPGCRRFREQVTRRAMEAGCVLSASDLVITNGTMEALHVALRAVSSPGDVIAVESPTFFGTLQLLESLGLRALEVPTHPRYGVVLEELKQLLDRRPVKACLFSPNFQNPLGTAMSDQNKQDLVAMLADREIPLIEDDIYGELPFDGPRPRAAKAFDDKGLVLWCASLSKTLSPGLRAGWIAPGRYYAEVERLKSIYTVTSAPTPLLVAAEFLESGLFERHIRGLRIAVRDNARRLIAAVADCFPAGTQTTHPAGGMVLWVELPEGCDSLALQQQCLAQGIGIAPGPVFSASGKYPQCVRLNCGMTWNEKIERALAKVGSLARNQLMTR